jgi:urocanate hydratase
MTRGWGVKLHADAGYEMAKETAKKYNLDIEEELK